MSTEPNDKKTEPTAEELNEWYERFLASTFAKAEDHLKLIRGTLADSKHDTDFIAVMKMASTIEPLINEALRKEVSSLRKHKVEHEGAIALSDFVTDRRIARHRKQQLARDLGIISEERSKFISALYKVRDRYAHNVQNLHLSIRQIADKIADDEGNKSIIFDLCGMDAIGSLSNVLMALYLRLGMYHRFAGFLADAFNILKPPPSLGSLLGKYAPPMDLTKPAVKK